MSTKNIAAAKLGFWSALLAFTFSLSYVIGQVAEWLGYLGSAGGPESASTPLGIVVLLIPSLFLGPSFLILIVSIHYCTPVERKIWSHLAIVFAVIYTTLISINYFIQLTLVLPHMLQGELNSIRFLLFTPFDSFLYSVDILGYSFMSLSTLFVAMTFIKEGLEKTARLFLLANGLILPFIALQNYYHPLIWGATLWAITFPGAMLMITLLMKKNFTQLI